MEHYTNSQYPSVWGYSGIPQTYMTHQQAMAAYHQNPHAADWATRPSLVNPKATESKPRLAKEEVEQLEAEFQKNPKPNSNLKKGLAEQMRVDVARINNWFQNRRAKAKQERRTAEYEAKQRAEKERAEPQVSEFFGESNHSDTLRPSSAPLPAQQSSSPASNSPSPVQSPANAANPHADTIAESIEEDESSAHSSPVVQTYVSPQSPYGTSSGAGRPGFFYSSTTTAEFDSSPNAGASLYNYAIPMFTTMFDGSQTTSDDRHDPMVKVEYSLSAHSSPGSYVQSPTQSGYRSPDLTIASRRNAPRLAPLGTGALHHRVPNGPKTVDGSRLFERPGGTMRRVSSAGSSVRVQKSISASPLSSCTGSKSELLLQMAQSPSHIASAVAAPPTPDTPILAGSQVAREATAISNSSDDDAYSANSLFDTSLTTPPTTPGVLPNISQTLYTAGGNYGYHHQNSLGGAFGADADFASIQSTHTMQATYYAGSQPTTPSYPPHTSTAMAMGSYHVYPTANDYGWPQVASSRTSPGVAKQGHYESAFGYGAPAANNF